MPTEPRTLLEDAARELLGRLAALGDPPALRVVAADGRAACLILVWDATRVMPTLAADKKSRVGGRRVGCKRDIVAAIRAAGRPLTRKQLIRVFRETRAGHGPGTVAKALADLTAAGELVNPKDKRGYRLPEWPERRKSPSLFD